MSAIGTRPSRTARICSGPLKPSCPPAFTSMSTAPFVAFFTSSAKRLTLTVWKLPSGQTVASGSLRAACPITTAGAPTIAIAPTPTPAFKAFLRPSFIETPIVIRLNPVPVSSRCLTLLPAAA